MAATSSPCMYADIMSSDCTEGVSAVMYAVIKCQRRRVVRTGSRRQADERITNLAVQGDHYLRKPLVFDCCPMCHGGPAEVWLVEGQDGMCDARTCNHHWLAMLTCCNIMRCRECLAQHVLMEETRALQAATDDVMRKDRLRVVRNPPASAPDAVGSEHARGGVQPAATVIRSVESDGVGTNSRRGVSTGAASSDPVNLVSSEEGTSDH
eukprot:SAG11_NODE_7099_length_1193_cov_9.089580_1_plen_209_part_00